MNHKIFCLLLCFVWTINGYGQTKKAYLAAAEKATFEKNTHGALVYFDNALSFDKNDAQTLYKTAEAARNYHSYGFAASKYHCLLDTLKNNDFPEATYRLGEMYHKLGNYDKATYYYNQYLSEYSNADPKITAEARKGTASAIKAKELTKNVDPAVTITRMGDEVNSTEADFGASDRSGNMYFSSMKYEAKAKNLHYKQIAKTLVKPTNNPSDVVAGYVNDRDQSIANFAFNTNGTKVFYSICDYVDGFRQRCDIYSSDVDKDGNLSNEQKLPVIINDPSSTNTQPNIGIDKVTGKETLYFVSDRTGGQGGLDIWSCIIDGGAYGRPENFTSINTPNDEITPFYHAESKTLYFSTDGRDGFGGFDVFSLPKKANTPSLLPAPNNTSMNDMYYYLNTAGTEGYLTSNRAGSTYQFESYEACCMDIYKVVNKDTDIILDVTTYLTTDKSDLNATTICLIDGDTGKELECIVNPLNGNKQSFKLKPNKNYKLVAKKDGYTIDTQSFTTTAKDKKLIKKLYLEPAKLKLDVFTFENPTKALLPGTTVTLIDLSDNSIQQKVVTNKDGNDFSFMVDPNKEYKLIATKDGYTTATDMISTKGATGTIKKDMYLQKATLQELLPISLYFDNDYPNPRSNSPQTTTEYVALANDYLQRKEDYIKNYTQPLSGVDKDIATNEIESFFRDDVQDGRDRFVRFLTQLEQRLASGEKIELEVRGFASPRAKSGYNKILSERRINCIKNEMRTYGIGGINKYLADGSLKIKDISFGNEKAKANVIGDLKDTRNSIYNLNAARERRVEILKVNYN